MVLVELMHEREESRTAEPECRLGGRDRDRASFCGVGETSQVRIPSISMSPGIPLLTLQLLHPIRGENGDLLQRSRLVGS